MLRLEAEYYCRKDGDGFARCLYLKEKLLHYNCSYQNKKALE